MMRITTLLALTPFLMFQGGILSQTSTPWEIRDPHEVRLRSVWNDPTVAGQGRMFSSPQWRHFAETHPGWKVIFDEARGLVHRAFGPAILDGDAMAFIEARMEEWAPGVELAPWRQITTGRNTLHRTHQVVEGRKVRGSEVVVTESPEGIISWGIQVHPQAAWSAAGLDIDESLMISIVTEGLDLTGLQVAEGAEYVVADGRDRLLPVREWTVSGRDALGIPVRYSTLLDLSTMEVVERTNEIRHAEHSRREPAEPLQPMVGSTALLAAQVVGTVHTTQPFEAPMVMPFDHLQVTTQGGPATTFEGGQLILEDNAPMGVSIPLSGLWSHVQSNGVTPVMEAVIEGDTILSIDPGSNIRERSAYYNVGRIHDHMKFWLPDFTLMDNPLETNVDVSGTCNAFYSPAGPSINFYTEGDGCNAFSLVADVVFHEYGHGINDLYYQSIGGNFINGAMGEGYADFWAISLSDNPILGAGCYLDNPEFFIRRYDEDPKIYPQDLVGQVHADGEIICGAWYDTHLLLGGDWELTMPLFMAAYAGMQAETPNGNEGEAFVEVLLAVLEADDDDGDLTNGTPNGTAILTGFAMHGITLFSNVEIGHESLAYATEEVPLTITAEADIQFPLNLVQFFSHMNLYYRTSPFDAWEVMQMQDNNDGTFTADIPAQPMGTVVEYHFGIADDFGAVSAITPFSADNAENPNLPFNTIIGVTPVLVDDQDDYSEFGFWSLGLPDDLATTGEWESTIPIGSFSNGPTDPSSICAPDEDHTPGDGLFCFLTGVSPGPDAGIGANDVDEGHTTLQSEDIDLSDMLDPVLSYWRWYVNAPASGANPGADWWQVAVSDDGGASWVEIEETLTQDISWRRHAFRIQEYVELTDAFKIRFIASDSLRLGQEYDGGSLIEAAVDDLVIHDLVVIGVPEQEAAGILAWPVPFQDRLHSAGWSPEGRIRLLDALGRVVAVGRANARGEVHLDVSGAFGTYILTGRGTDGGIRQKEVVGGMH